MEGNVDPGVEAEGLLGLVRHGEVLEFVQGVGGVGDEFPQEDLPVGIEGMDDEVQQLADLGLKLVLCHGVAPLVIVVMDDESEPLRVLVQRAHI
jgi:hypothetical protein